jgi:uncharacterized surface protein with fasciclin (FAS1) repeats
MMTGAQHIKILLPMLLVPVAAFLMTRCSDEEPQEAFFTEDEELLISDYLEEHSDQFSTLIEVLEITNLKNTLNAYGHYTFFAPDNGAFEAFCAGQGKGSVKEFDPDYLATLVRYHLIDIEMESSYFRDGVIQDTTYSGDHLVITFSEGGLETIMVNDARIKERDIHVENGIIHTIDGVLTPLVGSIVDRLDGFSGYSIFSEALDISGLSDSLDIIRIDLNQDIYIRSRFTLFVEPDEVYRQEGIADAEDLVARYSDTGDPASKEDGFYQYMAYHILPGLYYLNEIDSFNYATLAENRLLNVKLADEIYLNREIEQGGVPVEGPTIRVQEELSNQQAKNGVFHVIDHILEPSEPVPAYFMVDFTDYQGLSIGQTYTERDIEDIPGLYTENTGIWFRNSILADGETNLQTTSDRAGWSVEFKLAPILKGKYDVTLYYASFQGQCGSAQAFWDEARFGEVFSFVHHKRWPGVEWKYDYNTDQYMARLYLTETGPHTLKFISLEDGFGNFDFITFTPVTE